MFYLPEILMNEKSIKFGATQHVGELGECVG